MAGIKISKDLKNKLPENEKVEIEKRLIQKSNNSCFLCGKKFNFATDTIVADHNIPEADSGPTNYSNLNLVHEECNSFKRANPTLIVQKFLPFKLFIEENPSATFKEACSDHFKLVPKEISITMIKGDFCEIDFPNGTSKTLEILSETRPDKTEYKYIYTQVPISAIYNDDLVQPRSIKYLQVYKIFQDLHKNPLHEPSSVRLSGPFTVGKNKLFMFDGQHKSIAKMLASKGIETNLDIKIYIDFDQVQANYLVNSIQSRITKLILTKSEVARKMGDEFRPALEKYQLYCEDIGVEATENGYLQFVPKADLTRAKDALIQARFQQFFELDQSEFRILDLLEGKSKITEKKLIINETTFINKILKSLMYMKPLNSPIDPDDKERTTERNNIVTALNSFYDNCLAIDLSTATAGEKEKVQRFKSQSVLNLICGLIKEYLKWKLVTSEEDFLAKNLFDPTLKNELNESIIRFSNHPIWTASNDKSPIVKEFYNNLEKNSSLKEVGNKIKLNLSYIAGTSELDGMELN